MCNHCHENKHNNNHEHLPECGSCNHGHASDNKLIFRIIGALFLFIFFILFKPERLVNVEFSPVVKFAEFFICYLIAAYNIVLNAFKNVMKRQLSDENFLMTIATFGAFGVGEYPEAVMVMVLYQIGELFNSYAVKKSRKSVSNLMKMNPEYANVVRDGSVLTIHPSEVKIGEIILVKPGEKIPLDGLVEEGSSSVDTSNLTGESIPRELTPGDTAVSGCINLNGVLKIKVTKEFKNSTVTKILELVENAANKKAKAEKFITKFAKVYTPFVVASAVLLALLPPLVLGGGFLLWFKRALIFLVIPCPCALVISVPLGFFAGVGAASKRGILVKGSSNLETLSKAKTFVFDKTGTLTEGRFAVSKVLPAAGVTKDELLKFAAYVENFSTHPVAQAVKAAYGAEIDVSKIEDLKEYAGFGVTAKVFSKSVIAGSAKIMDRFNIASEPENAGGTVVYIAIDGKFAGSIVVSDTIKADAKSVIVYLKKLGVKTVMLTGDRENAALEIQKAAGIDTVYSNLLPNEKTDVLEKLLAAQKRGETLVFTGDGINDAPVLSRADIGISMGKLGSDAAIEASDIVITDDNLAKIHVAVGISKKTLQIVKQNIVFALSTKALFLALGAFGLVTMWGAVFADVGVSVLAILNSLRMLYIKRV